MEYVQTLAIAAPTAFISSFKVLILGTRTTQRIIFDMDYFEQQELDDSFFMDQCDFMESINEELATLIGDDFCNTNTFPAAFSNSSFSQTALTNNIPSSSNFLPTQQPQAESEPPAKQRKTNSDDWTCSIPIILNFGHANSTPDENPQLMPRPMNSAEEAVVSQALAAQEPARRTSRHRPPSQTYDHIVAERRRRELLSKRFSILSGMVPGLTKMDKTSVLGDAINYLHRLQERVKTLEKQATKQTIESLVLVKKSQICPKFKGVVTRLLAQVDNLNLTIVNTVVVTLGYHAFDITIIAEMEKDYSVLPKEIVRVLHSAILRDTRM
ncbi:UNVERIFIED_CONTAM: Transcription factor [Sesamum angustifolium]|uniref:Transcription factor n=1 Tax=Sesamum angustifolium TaxID=2727405 RepID=A0AAW2NLM2_9LAMI